MNRKMRFQIDEDLTVETAFAMELHLTLNDHKVCTIQRIWPISNSDSARLQLENLLNICHSCDISVPKTASIYDVVNVLLSNTNTVALSLKISNRHYLILDSGGMRVSPARLDVKPNTTLRPVNGMDPFDIWQSFSSQ